MNRRRPPSPRPGPTGFTLLEVLLAVALFALAVMVLAASYINIIQGLESVKTDHAFEQEVRWIREQVLQEPDLKVLEKGGQAQTLDFGPARWDVAVQSTTVPDLFVVQLHVVLGADKSGGREWSESFQALRPSWSDPTDRGNLIAAAKKAILEDRQRRGIASSKGTR